MIKTVQELQESEDYEIVVKNVESCLVLQEEDLVVFKNDKTIYEYMGLWASNPTNLHFRPIDGKQGWTVPRPVAKNMPVSFVFRKRRAHYFRIKILRTAHEEQTMKAFSKEELIQRLEERGDIVSYEFLD